ncbi:ParB N-terminal domain-containing protein [Microbacterium sp. W4I20]|uniref:ParB N-terminal domain-containing protein n=1 Tax=Microbacterium sp. W4I20 TaxID=3042262 RepID=UPI002780F0DE|nr:ParB N-terminal domain-containing protein [Microbacterium sp. W4I20]MDQ0728768.1 ParB family chromosome partitioning protein [Microbacterium sp. W4I20]
MSTDNGHIELERSVDSIRVGRRHRTELGDLASLAASIERDGMLQPITVTPEGILVCGARRLAAIKQLGWLHVKVWVRSGVSGDLGYLLAEQDDNVLHKPLTQLENATLYREIKTLMAEDAARRQEASRFSRDNQPGDDGAANSAAPLEAVGDAREQAAAMIPDGPSHTTLEKINYLQHLVDDETQPESVREGVAAELELIGCGSAVHPSYERARQLVAAAQPGAIGENVAKLAEEALARIEGKRMPKRRPSPSPAARTDGDSPWPVRAFVVSWTELDGWWRHFTVDDLAHQLSDAEVDLFFHVVDATVDFAEQLRAFRNDADSDTKSAARSLRAV